MMSLTNAGAALRAIDITSSLNGLWTERFPTALSMGLLIVFLSTLEQARRISMKNFQQYCLWSPAFQEEVTSASYLWFHWTGCYERDYFRKCERAKFDIWFTVLRDFKLWCKWVWNRSFFHFPFSKCNTVKWQRLITEVITVGKQRGSWMRRFYLWWPSISWQLCLIPTTIILRGQICWHKPTEGSHPRGNISKRYWTEVRQSCPQGSPQGPSPGAQINPLLGHLPASRLLCWWGWAWADLPLCIEMSA